MPNILILGGCGYIGSRLHDKLSQTYEVQSVDLEWYGKTVADNIKEDYKNLPVDFISQYDVVILVAGQSSERMCDGQMVSVFDNHVANFVELLEKIRATKKHIKFIYASTCRVYYGSQKIVSTEEDVSFTSSSPYDINMYMKDIVINHYQDIEYYGLRLGTVNGYSRLFRSESLINSMVLSALDSRIVNTFNDHINRSVLDMSDLVWAVRKIIEIGSKEKSGIYNLSSFNGTVKDIGEHVAYKLRAKIRCNGFDTIKPLSFSMNTEKFQNAFNFKFNGSVDSIVDSIRYDTHSMIFSSRIQPVAYGLQRPEKLLVL